MSTQSPNDEDAQSQQAQPAIASEGDAAPDDDLDPFAHLEDITPTTSLDSDVENYQYENGRRYHGYRAGEYVMPNDKRERKRLQLQHRIFKMVLGGKLHRAPISEAVWRILDVGTGTGAWAIDMADEMPQAAVTGTDLSPIQPHWIPPNSEFQIDDFEQDWTFDIPFDFIHARNIEGSVADHRRLFQQALNHLTPGGWLEISGATAGVFCDDESIELAPNMLEWRDRLIEASHIFGKPKDVAKYYRDWLEEVGFRNVREEIYHVPYSPWPGDPKLKRLGVYQQKLMLESLDSYTLALFTRVLKWDFARMQLLLAGVRKELRDQNFHGYSKLYFVYGQKP